MKNVTMYDLISKAREKAWEYSNETIAGLIAIDILLLVAESKTKNETLNAVTPIIAMGNIGVAVAQTLLMGTDPNWYKET